MSENFNRQFILFDFKQLDDPAFLDFIGTAEFKTFLILLRYIWRGGSHRLGLDELYHRQQRLVAAVGRDFVAQKLGLTDPTRVSKHFSKLEDLKVIQRMRTGRETIFVLGEWIDISEENDGSTKKEWFYYERVFGKARQLVSSNETRKGSEEDSTTDVAQNATSDMQNEPHQKWPGKPHQMWPKTPRNNIQSNNKILKAVNVNADFEEKTEKTDLRKLPNIEQDTERTKYIAEEIVSCLGDKHSQAFYYLVAAKIPESEIWRALSEIKESKPQSPAAVFTSRMKNYATTQLAKKRLNSVYSSKKLAEHMSVR
jgi:hypothetical protein